MAKQGKRPIGIPKGVNISMESGGLNISGSQGTLNFAIPSSVSVTVEKDRVQVGFSGMEKPENLRGLVHALIRHRLKCVTEGITKKLEVVGVGYQAEVKGKDLVLKVGFSHSVPMEVPEGLKVKIEKSIIAITGIDPEKVGDFAAKVRAVRPPEPYGGKGIRYFGEYVRHKVGKTAGVGVTPSA
ncbi:MAG: 50S ribosomal protein L6 [bacterium (Candidatus Ratteibacteria) CG23_combo_of_CG06-09_8_20_14_all_48_7]|uniref:50S ribosomal protein L6 n=1 Tax=bacterium (Candidatus Ratteibacteria) CG23_combo_of_CG06-09_8_20_14_all_48_7 TaxID=2014292 RepID=A0A2G9YC09_9BACT|nr:MAG: 50S ribosomal protein L6 [bacterium (Candidatus Ratteibacteria) CG23_combo_of_CG06-09_8_20_14_all_48_7]